MPRLETVGHAPLPGNGNSGSHGKPQEYRGELTVAAAVLKESDPELAGQLMHAWRIGGRPVQDQEHPLLTATTLDESIPSVTPAWESVHRQGLGIISKATNADGAPVWALFRAGSATHHMDFDQGHIHLAAWDTELLGDHGYHTEDSEGNPIPAFTTWVHSTVTYARDRNLACGYTGIEKAPSPLLAHLGADFDWCVHRIVNNNYRDPSQFTYLDMLPAPETVHYRHYLFVKPDYFVLWDTFERLDGPATFRLHPTMPVVQTSGTSFRAGEAGKPHLLIDFAQPEEPVVVENGQVGPLWCLGIQQSEMGPFLAVLSPCRDAGELTAQFDDRELHVRGPDFDDRISLPPPGSTDSLPQIRRS